MAKFLSYYNLCQIHDTKEFLGISKDREDGNIITTIGRNIIIIIKLSNQKQVRSWTVFEKLSSKVVFDQKSNKYVGVFSNKSIRCWDDSNYDINKVKKIKFEKNIADLIATESNETIIIYGDGTYEYLSNAIQDGRKVKSEYDNEHFKNNSLILDSNLFDLKSGLKMLTFFKENSKNNSIELVVNIFNQNNDKFPTKYFPLTRYDKNIKLSGYTVVDGKDSPSLFTIWSDKRIFLMPLNDSITSKDSPGTFISMLNELNLNNPISICGVSKNCIVIYGGNTSQEGASLILYSTQFKIIKSKQFFKIYFNFSHLWVIGCHILLAMGHNLSVATFKISKELLSEVIGSQTTSNDIEKYISDDFINEEYYLEENLELDLDRAPELNPKPRAEHKKTIIEIADGKMIAYEPIDSFEEKLKKLSLINLNLEITKNYNSESDSIQIVPLSNLSGKRFNCSEIEEILQELKKCGASEQECIEKILPILIKLNFYEDIVLCIKRFTNITEKMLIKALRYAIEYSKEIDENFIEANNKFELLNTILMCNYDSEILSKFMRNEINFNQITYLLEYLYKIQINTDILDIDDDIKIFNWFSLLLSAYYQDFALSKDINLIKILYDWIKLLNDIKIDLENLDELHAIMLNLVCKKKICQGSKTSKWYSIEEVQLY